MTSVSIEQEIFLCVARARHPLTNAEIAERTRIAPDKIARACRNIAAKECIRNVGNAQHGGHSLARWTSVPGAIGPQHVPPVKAAGAHDRGCERELAEWPACALAEIWREPGIRKAA